MRRKIITSASNTAQSGDLPLRRPSFFLVGAPKAGTTSMNSYLALHPDIFMATKELHYFSGEAFSDPPIEERDLFWYLSEFERGSNKKAYRRSVGVLLIIEDFSISH